MIKKILLSLVLALTLLSGSNLVFAATPSITEATEVTPPTIPQSNFLPGPTSGTQGSAMQEYVLNSSVPKAMNIGIGLLGIAAFLGLLIAAIQLLTAYGDDTKVTRGKTNLKYSIMGFIIVIISYALVSIVVSVALPKQSDNSAEETSWLIPTAHAVNAEDDVKVLLPSVESMIEVHDEQGRVSLPSGNFLEEIVPSIITNVMYFVTFLVFITFIYGGSLIVIGRGNEEEVTKAKNIILYSAIGLGLLAFGYVIIYGIATLNLNQDSTTVNDDVFTQTQNE